MKESLSELLQRFDAWIESATANIKLVDQALTGMQGSYVELLTLLGIGMLAVVPVFAPPGRRRQAMRHLTQAAAVFIFIFVVYTCMGVFGMIRNFHRGLMEIGRENIIALYFCSVPAVILVTSMIFGPAFCGWICPTGALQELAGRLFKKKLLEHKRSGRKRSRHLLIMAGIMTVVFLGWVAWLSATRVFFVEDAGLYWSEALVILIFLLAFRMREWDRRLRRLRIVSFLIILGASVMGWRVLSPVHFTFSKVYDPASVVATVMVVLGAMAVSHVWCRYFCPWREAIAWAAKHSARKIEFNAERCTGCGLCDEVCGVDAIKKGRINMRECHFCLKCVDACPEKALEVCDIWKPER